LQKPAPSNALFSRQPAVPLLREERIIGGLVVRRKSTGEFHPEVIELLKTFATQSVLAIQNARLFREIEDKSWQIEAANRHKSEFLFKITTRETISSKKLKYGRFVFLALRLA
jgi:GAF domain-containing protein